MRTIKHITAVVAVVLMSVGTAHAASGNSVQVTGSARAAVIIPVSMTNVSALSFGQFARPNAAGTMTISPAGAVSTTGGVTGNEAIVQTGGGRAAARFTITVAPGAGFTVFGPISTTLSSGSNTMTVTNLTGSLALSSSTATSRTYTLMVGGRLNVAANQAIGTYNGTYTLTTVYQ